MDRMPHSSSAQRLQEYIQPQSQKSTPHTTPLPTYQPSAAQPPVQIGLSDPFHNRDPFLPPSQHHRRASYGHLNGNGAPTHHYSGERAWHHPQGHIPQSPHYPPFQPQPSRLMKSQADAHPPPSFAARNMPPPSPSSNPSASFGGSRGGMSISSLIGSDTARNGPTSPKAATAHNSPTLRSPQGLQRPRSTSVRSDIGHTNRPLSPRHGDYARHPDPRAAPDHRFVPYPYGPHSNTTSFRNHQSSPTSAHSESTPSGSTHAPPRPNSQPVGLMQGRAEDARPPNATAQEIAGFRHYNGHSFRPSEMQHRPPPDAVDRRFGEEAARRMPTPDHARMPIAHQPSHMPPSYGPHEPHSAIFRPAYPMHGPSHEVPHAPLHDLRQAEHQQLSPAPSETSIVDSRFRQFGPPVPQYHSEEKQRRDPGRREPDENTANNRNLLNVSPELNRVNGRGSPLPQAVQGAQPRPGLPGRDPSVKNEFGRMFSGLGSGVGGSGTPIAGFSGNGTTTPSRLSPRLGEAAEIMQSTEGDHAMDGPTSKRRGRRADEDHEIADGRNTPAGGQKTNKRAKTSHQTHHHHHHHQHAHAHHHHHHHHDEHAHHAAGGFGTLKFAPTANGSQTAAPPAHHHHHHHDHHHANHAHHHHHGKSLASTLPQITIHDKVLMQSVAHMPRNHLGSALYSTALSMSSNKHTINDIKFAFDTTVKPIPRFEGKENCTFTVRVPREYLQMSDSDVATSVEIAGGLEEICRRRAIWGTGIYTDDSDVVAAAVHSGWIRGDYGESNNDIRTLVDQDSGPNKPSTSPTVLDERPQEPVRVPQNLDMHVTVLILPALQDYAGSVMHNLRSRPWPSNHDGMSFKIHSIHFVDEPRYTRFTERGVKGIKKRIMEENAARQTAAEALLGMMGSGRSVRIGA